MSKKILTLVGGFVTWWFDSLSQSLPASIRRFFTLSHPVLLLQLTQDDVVEVYWQQDNKTTHRGGFALTDTDQEIQRGLLSKAQKKQAYQIDLRLNPERVLHLQKPYPESVRENLKQTVRYQLDRITPFHAQDVYFDAVTTTPKKQNSDLQADIFVVPRGLLAHIKEHLQRFDINRVDRISVLNAPPSINLLSHETATVSQAERPSRWPLYFFLMALAASLLLPVLYKNYRLSTLDSALDQLRSNAAAQLHIRDQLKDAEDALYFIREKRQQLPISIDVVEHISAELPKHSWLQRLILKGERLELKGESENALSLIDLLEASEHFSQVKFISPITRDKKSGKDRFHLQLSVDNPVKAAENATSEDENHG